MTRQPKCTAVAAVTASPPPALLPSRCSARSAPIAPRYTSNDDDANDDDEDDDDDDDDRPSLTARYARLPAPKSFETAGAVGAPQIQGVWPRSTLLTIEGSQPPAYAARVALPSLAAAAAVLEL